MQRKNRFITYTMVSLLLLACVLLSACGNGPREMTYLGVENYGAEETNAENKDSFRYLFMDGEKVKEFSVDNGTKDEEGNYDYPIQNSLKENYRYKVTIENEIITDVEEISEEMPAYTPPVSGTPGEKTLSNFLKTALMPVGTTLYIYGGGWDWQDAGSAIQTRTIGVSPDWIRFFQEQDDSFTYKGKDGDEENVDPTISYYPFGAYNEYYYAGLDCSGYLGWVLYNTFETESGGEGYVGGSTGFAKRLSENGWGTWTQEVSAPDGEYKTRFLPGDIMSINGHVWISLGTCDDGSVLIVHSTPTDSRSGQPGGGVQIGAIGTDESCEAYQLADDYMKTFCPDWYARYPACLKEPETYYVFEGESAGLFSWDVDGGAGLTDPEGVQDMKPAEVLKALSGS